MLVFESDGKMWQKIVRQMVRSTAEDALDEIDEDGSDFD